METDASIERYLQETELLDYSDRAVRQLIRDRGWKELDEPERIRAVHDFVRDEIPFGYNRTDDLPASKVLADGYGQCNTKSTLLMALLRAVGIRTRLHGFTIHKSVQAGIVPKRLFQRAPEEILHTWVEVQQSDAWIELEGFILDHQYLGEVKKLFPEHTGAFCGLGVATDSFESPSTRFDGGPTHIQKGAIVKDLGLFDSPDEFYHRHGANFSGVQQMLFSGVVRRVMNAHVERIRKGDGANVLRGRLPWFGARRPR